MYRANIDSNDVRISRWVHLIPADRLSAKLDLSFPAGQAAQSCPMPPPPASTDGTTAPQDQPVDAAWHARLRITKGPGTGTSFPVTALVTTLGRHPGCDIMLDDPTVSRHHAAVHCHGDAFTLADAGSANGTSLNGRPVLLTDLTDGDEIEIGKFRLTFRLTHLSTREHQS